MEVFGTFTQWVHGLSIAELSLGLACAVTIALDGLRRPQRMWLMNLLWPPTGELASDQGRSYGKDVIEGLAA